VDRVVQPACEPQVQRTLGGPHNVRQHAAERARENNPRAARELADRKRSAGEVQPGGEPFGAERLVVGPPSRWRNLLELRTLWLESTPAVA
jgi:hypothetical protein